MGTGVGRELLERGEQEHLFLPRVVRHEISQVPRAIAPAHRSRAGGHERREGALLCEMCGARLCHEYLELGDQLEAAEDDVLRLRVRDQPQPDPIERGPQLGDRRSRCE